MRKTWVAIAVLAAAVGYWAVHRSGRSGQPQAGPAPAKRTAEQAETGSKPEGGRTVPRRRREDEAAFPPRGKASASPDASAGAGTGTDEEARSDRRAAAATTSPGIREAAEVPAATDSRPLPEVADPGEGAPSKPSHAPPQPPPPAAPAPHSTPTSPSPSTDTATTEPEKEAAPTPPPDDPESDRRPPVLQSLRFDPPEIKDGTSTTLSIGCVDDLSGIKFVYGAVRSPSGAAMIGFSAREVDGNGQFSTPIAIPARGETGEWHVGNLQIVDKAENNLAITFSRATVPAGGVLRVVSDDSDATPPEVRRVSVVNPSVDAGEKNRVIVEVDDDRSGVAMVNGSFQSPSKAAFIPFNCSRNGESTLWEGDVAVPHNAECGEWTLRQLRVVDRANNSAFLSGDSPQVGRVAFAVTGGGSCDAEPPTIESIYFTPTSATEGAVVVLTVSARDDGAGVASVSGWIEGPIATNGLPPRVYFESTALPGGGDAATMTARITVPPHAAKGTWRVALAQVTDRARNTRAYSRNDPALSTATFTVE